MGRREDFDNALWSDPDFLGLSSEARMTYIWSWTNPRCGMSGLYKVAPAQAALETGYAIDVVKAALEELGANEFAFYEANVMFVRTRCRRLRTKSEQIAKSVRNDLMGISDSHPLKAQFLSLYADQPWLRPFISEGRASVDSHSGEVHGKQPSKPDAGNLTRGSGDPRSTFPGNGNGTGKGKVPRGRGAGRGGIGAVVAYVADPDIVAIQAEHFPAVDVAALEGAARELRRHDHDVTPEALREHLAEVYRDLGVQVEGVTC